jgi:aquaporin Z
MNYLPLIYEFLGTFLLVLSIFTSGNPLVIGITLAIVVWLSAAVSGGHVNPAVSLAFFMKGALTTEEVIGYIFVQLLGGLAAFSTFQFIV